MGQVAAAFAGRALGKNDGAVRPSRGGKGVLKALRHRQHGNQHTDHARNADNGDQGGTQPLSDSAEKDFQDRENLLEHDFPFSARPAHPRWRDGVLSTPAPAH